MCLRNAFACFAERTWGGCFENMAGGLFYEGTRF